MVCVLAHHQVLDGSDQVADGLNLDCEVFLVQDAGLDEVVLVIITFEVPPTCFEPIALSEAVIEELETLLVVNLIDTLVCVGHPLAWIEVLLDLGFPPLDVLFVDEILWRIPEESGRLVEDLSQFGFHLLFDLLWCNVFGPSEQALEHVLGILYASRPRNLRVVPLQLHLCPLHCELMLNLLVKIQHVDDWREPLHLLLNGQL
jgi:hypothetical protein